MSKGGEIMMEALKYLGIADNIASVLTILTYIGFAIICYFVIFKEFIKFAIVFIKKLVVFLKDFKLSTEEKAELKAEWKKFRENKQIEKAKRNIDRVEDSVLNIQRNQKDNTNNSNNTQDVTIIR
jgi:predicted PurR-regulated permease PerM